MLVIPPADGPGGGLPVPLNNFRDEDSNTRVYRFNWDRVISSTLVNRVSFGYNDWFQARVSFNSDKGWGTKIGLKNVPGPDGRPWQDTTIRGQAERGTGILNNELYNGQLVWNRCSYIKDPRTGRRLARTNGTVHGEARRFFCVSSASRLR